MKSRFLNEFFTVSIALAICICASFTLAQKAKTKVTEATKSEEIGIALARLIDLPRTKHRVVVDLSQPQDMARVNTDLASSNIIIKFLPSGKTVPTTLINNVGNQDANIADTASLPGFNGERIQIGLASGEDAAPNPGDNKFEITFVNFHFSFTDASGNVKNVAKKLVGSGKIYNRGNIGERVEETRQALKDAVAAAKTEEEKSVFAGLNIVVPSGGKTEGNSDIHINKNLYAATLGQSSLFSQIQFGFHLKKASEPKADARHFDVGIKFRKTFLRASSAELNRIKQAINNSGQSEIEPANIVKDINKLQKQFVRAVIFDNELSFEGDASKKGIGNVSNFLLNSQVQVATVSRGFAGQTGFWNFRWIPIGLEIGTNLTNGDVANQKKTSLARIKTGGELNLIFKDDNSSAAISRIDFRALALDRYLFKRESTIDQATQLATLTDKGHKYWLQADLKVTTGFNVGLGRVGFKTTFNRGFLPPVYNFVKTLNFGLFFETRDDDNSGDLK